MGGKRLGGLGAAQQIQVTVPSGLWDAEGGTCFHSIPSQSVKKDKQLYLEIYNLVSIK